MPISRLPTCLLWGFLALLAGCGSPEKPRAAAALQACALVSAAEAAQALGQAVGPAQPRDPGNPLGQTICFYPGGDEPRARFVQISLVTTGGMKEEMRAQGYSAAKLYADTKALLEDRQSLAGLGGEAFSAGSGLKAGAGVHVIQGESYLNIVVASGDQERDLAQARELAALALKRLP